VPDAQLGHMPPAICTFVHLTHLDLSGNGITMLPYQVSQLTSLQVGGQGKGAVASCSLGRRLSSTPAAAPWAALRRPHPTTQPSLPRAPNPHPCRPRRSSTPPATR
jgi:hypothetical protein